MQQYEFMHPEDQAALEQMQSIPGFTLLVKKVLSIGLETMQYGINMASTIKLSDKQLPDIYRHLPPICNKLGIVEPEFYLQMDPNPNAWTFGDTRVFITITSGLLDMMNDEELDAVIAHECGHILCHHVLYHTIARWLAKGIDVLGIIGSLAIPLQYAMLYWYRKSELSADRAASIVTSPETVAKVMARLAGGPQKLTAQIDLKEWAKQADEYDEIQNSDVWNKALQLSVIAGLSHPFAAVRVREILKWGDSEQYRMIKNSKFLPAGNMNHCPHCNGFVDKNWKFCRNCGGEL